MAAARPDDRVRLAEVLAALSLATDLGLGRPLEHQLGVCLAAVELARRLDCTPPERAEVFYLALLAHVGCTAVAQDFAAWAGGDDLRFQRDAQAIGPASSPAEDVRHLARRFASDRPLPERALLVGRAVLGGQGRFAPVAATLCEAGRLLAERLALPGAVPAALGQVTARWDGRGVPALGGDQLPRALRIVRVAHDLVAVAAAGGPTAAAGALRGRRGRGHDPAVVDAALAEPETLLAAARTTDPWARLLDAEPEPVRTVPRAAAGMLAEVFGEFTDLKVPFLRGHSRRVADVAARALATLGATSAETAELHAAGCCHDLGRVSVPNGIWQRPGPLGEAAWERVRLHAYYSERVLERSGVLAPLARLAGAHHERLDGSGYHRGSTAAQLPSGARILAAADVHDALTHDRPYRAARDPRPVLGDLVRDGRLDKRAVDAVLDAAGAAPLAVRQGHPAGLTDREVEVVRLLAQGRTNKQIAAALVITEKTAGHHVEHVYGKAGVSTRAGVALFAMRHDLLG